MILIKEDASWMLIPGGRAFSVERTFFYQKTYDPLHCPGLTGSSHANKYNRFVNIIWNIFFEHMSENECRGEPCVRPRTKTGIEPMRERFIYILDHRFDNGFLFEGEHKVRPYVRSRP